MSSDFLYATLLEPGLAAAQTLVMAARASAMLVRRIGTASFLTEDIS